MTLSQYQDMIIKSREIQKLWIPKVGDEVLKNNQYLCTIKYIFKSDTNNYEDLIWIPTYGQLMDLIPIENYGMKQIYINETIDKLKSISITDNKEEIILRVIMYDNYDKLWNFEKKCWSQYIWD